MKQGRKLYGGVCAIVAMSFMIAACTISAQDVAPIRASSFSPTGYEERGWIAMEGPATGYRDKKIDERTYKIDVTGSEVTSQEQTINIALVRAAALAADNGYTHFTVSNVKMQMMCVGGGMKGANPMIELTAHFKRAEEVSDSTKAMDAGDVLRTKGLEIERPDRSREGKQRAYLANVEACRTGRLQNPENMKLKSEMDG
ncbi:MAG: hypothetical protein KF895_14215 [Parvibaculum sp.]|nr:hypothetical protein [Parvibaculum sp.]